MNVRNSWDNNGYLCSLRGSLYVIASGDKRDRARILVKGHRYPQSVQLKGHRYPQSVQLISHDLIFMVLWA